MEQTQAAADELAARYEETVARHAEVAHERDMAQTRIRDLETRQDELQAVLREFAAEIYVGAADPLGPLAWLDGGDVLGAQRRANLAELATEPQNLTIDELGALQQDVELERTRLDQAVAEAEELIDVLSTDGESLQEQLIAAQEAQTELEAQLAREEEAQRQAEQARQLVEQRRRAEATARQATTTTAPVVNRATPTPSTEPTASPPAEPAVSPASRSIVCPIRGAVSFVDSWGAPRSGGRSHQGVDLMSPNGTPNVAVVSGEVRQKEGGLSGLGVYLYGDDGNSYWYFHLSAYEGPPRRVEQGEVVGYVGSSGNADVSAPHTHFEYHPGGGSATNPYPLVRSVC